MSRNRSENPVVLSRIYTRTGDDGTTALADGSRTAKTDSRLAAYADVDEANCAIGMAITFGDLPPLRSFLLPGGSPGSTLLHMARTVTRRAERSAWAAAGEHGDSISPLPARYLNRLSDLLFILARQANAGHDDVLWKPGGDRV